MVKYILINKFVLLFLAFIFSQTATAGICEGLLSSPAKPGQIQILASQLLEKQMPYLHKALSEVTIVEKSKKYFWQRALSWKQQRFTGKMIITSRLPQWNSEEDKKKALWELANILYQTQVQKSLWNLQKIKDQLQLGDKTRMLDISMNGSDEELMGYFLQEAPAKWSHEWVDNLKGLNSELYQLLTELDVEDLIHDLPKKDPGRHKYRAFIFGLFASYDPQLNQEDFLTYHKDESARTLHSVLDKRYLKQTYLSWYTNFMKRFFTLTLIASTAPAWAFAVQEAPRVYHFLSHYNEIQSSLTGAADRLNDKDRLQKEYIKNLEQEVLKEYARLSIEIAKVKKDGGESDPRLVELQEGLASLIQRYPMFFKKTP